MAKIWIAICFAGEIIPFLKFGWLGLSIVLPFRSEMTNSHYNELNEVYTKYKDQGIIQTYIVLESVSSELI
jgi:hypothetical protein